MRQQPELKERKTPAILILSLLFQISLDVLLTLMGLFGTVVGLITMAMSLKGNLGGIDNLGAALSQAFEGYGVALATTAVGIVAGGWIEVNALFIFTATSCLEKDVAE